MRETWPKTEIATRTDPSLIPIRSFTGSSLQGELNTILDYSLLDSVSKPSDVHRFFIVSSAKTFRLIISAHLVPIEFI
jgi:hypothetical protein